MGGSLIQHAKIVVDCLIGRFVNSLFSPDLSNSFRDLNSFRIHGDAINKDRQGKASNRCPVLPPNRINIHVGEIFCVTQ